MLPPHGAWVTEAISHPEKNPLNPDIGEMDPIPTKHRLDIVPKSFVLPEIETHIF